MYLATFHAGKLTCQAIGSTEAKAQRAIYQAWSKIEAITGIDQSHFVLTSDQVQVTEVRPTMAWLLFGGLDDDGQRVLYEDPTEGPLAVPPIKAKAATTTVCQYCHGTGKDLLILGTSAVRCTQCDGTGFAKSATEGARAPSVDADAADRTVTILEALLNDFEDFFHGRFLDENLPSTWVFNRLRRALQQARRSQLGGSTR